MDIILNANCAKHPDGVKPLKPQGDPMLQLLNSLGYDANNPPLAELLKRYHQLEGDWIVVSPIHWQASHNDAVITAAGSYLETQPVELKKCYQSYADYLKEENDILHYHDHSLWLLRRENQPPLTAKPVQSLINKSLMSELDTLDNTMYWQKFITESQMFFASLNQDGHDSEINGVWLWGGAPLSLEKTAAICADTDYVALSQATNSTVTPYHADLDIRQFKLIILNDINCLSASHQLELTKMTTHWYWNNLAYTRPKSSWLTRLRGKLLNEH